LPNGNFVLSTGQNRPNKPGKRGQIINCGWEEYCAIGEISHFFSKKTLATKTFPYGVTGKFFLSPPWWLQGSFQKPVVMHLSSWSYGIFFLLPRPMNKMLVNCIFIWKLR